MKRNHVSSSNTVNKDGGFVELLARIKMVLNELKSKNYLLKLRREPTCINSDELQERIMPEDFSVDETYYFETISSPDANRMLYAISLAQGAKGFLIDSCDAYADNISPEMMQKLGAFKK